MKKNKSEIIKTLSQELGFSSCGISKARFLKEEEKKFEEWLKNGYQSGMSYLEKNFDKRLDPTKLVPGATVSYTHLTLPTKA